MTALSYYIHSFNPIFLDFGIIKIYYYGIIFAILFVLSYFLGRWFFQKKKLPLERLDTCFLLTVLGVVIGARLGHVIFYNVRYFSAHPLEIFYVWQGGLASHGAVIGLFFSILGIVWYLKNSGFVSSLKEKLFWIIGDIVALCGSLAVFLIRLANFINGEIVGRVTTVPWGIIFPCNGNVRGQCGDEPRHPSQLYEATVGLLLFILLFYIVQKKKYKDGMILGLFLTIYFSLRFILEFFKEYDGDLILAPLTNGHVLSLPFIIVGIVILIRLMRDQKRER